MFLERVANLFSISTGILVFASLYAYIKSRYDERKEPVKYKIYYSTKRGSCRKLAYRLKKFLLNNGGKIVTVLNIKTIQPDELISTSKNNCISLFIIPTYLNGNPCANSTQFFNDLDDMIKDFRVENSCLNSLHYCIFGVGDRTFTCDFNKAAIKLDGYFQKLGAFKIFSTILADVSNMKDFEKSFEEWSNQLTLKFPAQLTTSNNTVISSDDEESSCQVDNGISDLESLVPSSSTVEFNGQFTESNGSKPEMLNPVLRASLTKQGYKLVESHSGVKLCRWTKAMLRGRGGCYKHTFYGIQSHRCMEATPSLACANKCIFCWRHHSNPVGTEWKWKTDDADVIVEGILKENYKMLNIFKGAAGVKPERYDEALRVKHCALSLVGEPIMYPQINKMIDLLHAKDISTFLVTNAQFPEAIRDLIPVTQLYISVDASTKEALKAVDRPLFPDFWERFIASMEYLREKKQRTVYRLTLIKNYNMQDIDNYAGLIELGQPSFIEIKGVTYSGYTNKQEMSMQNVPYHEDVVEFGLAIAAKLSNYELCVEHEHSNCVLIAHKKFCIDGKWHTWINYDRFQELYQTWKQCHESGGEMNSNVVFDDTSYMDLTPEWALFNSESKGFDPIDTRFRRGKKQIPT